MKRQRILMITAAASLVALNIWQWWPQDQARTRATATQAGGFRPEDFQLRIETSPTITRAGLNRDLFQPKLPPAPPPVKKVEAPAGPPPKTPEQLAEEAARAELAKIKLVGVVFRGGKGQAFLVQGEQVFLAHAGDKVGQRFSVESIGTDNVVLKDATTNVSGQIPVSGK